MMGGMQKHVQVTSREREREKTPATACIHEDETVKKCEIFGSDLTKIICEAIIIIDDDDRIFGLFFVGNRKPRD